MTHTMKVAGQQVQISKSLVRDLANLNGLHDLTQEISERPLIPTLLSQMVQANPMFLQTNTFEHDFTHYKNFLPSDKAYAERGQVVDARPVTDTHLHKVPSFGVQAAIRPEDVLRRRKPGTDNELEAMEAVVGEDMAAIGRGWDLFKERAIAHAITTGTLYVPNGTVASVDFYQEYTGAARPTVTYTFTNLTVHPKTYGEVARRRILDNLYDGQQVSGFVAICSPEFFTSLTTHPKWEQAMVERSGLVGQDPLIKRFENFAAQYQQVLYADNVLYIEYAGRIGGTQIIPAGEAYMLPLGVDLFSEVYAPAQTKTYINTVAEREYLWRVDNEFDGTRLFSESNVGLFLQNPLLIQKLVSA